jgi:hypothetical protein
MNKRREWTSEEDDFLRSNYCLTNDELAERLACDASTIKRRFCDLEIIRPSGKNALAKARHSILRERFRGSVPEEWHGLPATRSDAKAAKSAFFWSGQPCAREGHISRRKTSSGGCWDCEYSDHKKRLVDDPEYREKRYANFRETYRKNSEIYLEKQRLRKDSDESRQWYREYERNKRKTDILWRLSKSLRDRLYKAVTRGTKTSSAIDIVGCSVAELKIHIENQFSDGMCWQNYGEWHIDHIRPCVSFDLTNIDQQMLCFHFSNLRPLWGKDNRSKGGIWQGKDPRSGSRDRSFGLPEPSVSAIDTDQVGHEVGRNAPVIP